MRPDLISGNPQQHKRGATMSYRLKLRCLKSRLYHEASRLARRLGRVGQQEKAQGFGDHLSSYISEYAPNRSFADIGCMWGISGHYCFLAEECGARSVIGVDVMYPTNEFTAKRESKNSQVSFIQGDFHDPALLSEIGVNNVVLCSGVLYHVPNPLDTLLCLRKICNQT